MAEKLKGSEYLARLMKAYGTTHLFFQEVVLRHTAKEAEQLGIAGILAHSEGAAGYMADGYARITGKPGVAMAQSIGSANLVGGVQDAWLATTPVIALTGWKTAAYQYTGAYQEADHTALYSGVTKFNAQITDPQQLPFLIRQCYREAVTSKPRPVHLDILGLTGMETEVALMDEPFLAQPEYGTYPPARLPAEANCVKKAADAIAQAKRPLIVAGRGAFISGAGDEILVLARKCDIPVVTTPDGKTVMDEADPLWTGIVGGYGMACANRTAAEADLVLFIGTQASDQTTCDWACPPRSTKVIQIDVDAGEPGRNYPDSIGLAGDAKTVVAQLINCTADLNRPEWRATVSAYVKANVAEHEKLMALDLNPIRTERLCHEVSQALPDNAVLVSDTGYSAIWSSTMIRMRPSQRYLRAAGSLGWAFPASLGVKCGAPDRPVVCFTGDGGFYYHLPEMETAMRHGINTVTVVNNNNSLAQCVPAMKKTYAGNEAHGVAKITFQPVNFAKVAEAFGLFAIRVKNPADIAPALKQALAADKPALVEVMTASADTCNPLPARA